jgi:hypothetical protein
MVGHLFPLIHASVHFAQLAQIQFKRGGRRRFSNNGKQSEGCYTQGDERAIAAKNFHVDKGPLLLLMV